MADNETVIGGYTLGEAIGQGGMGTVYRATGPDGRPAAVKLLHLHLTTIEEFVKRFHREAALARKLAHPNVVRVLDVGEDDGQHYMVMEYVEGETLAERLERAGIAAPTPKSTRSAKKEKGEGKKESPPGGRLPHSDGPPVRNLPVDEVIRITRQVAGVLQAASAIGLVHRDIKPQNILIDPEGNAKVLDFGLAKDTAALQTMLSMTGQSIGTPPYMSPEQCRGDKDMDVRGDLYSLGATAYQMLTGRPPFPGPSISAYHSQHLEAIPEPVVKVNPVIPENLSQVVDRLLAKDPADRHQSGNELIEDLNRVERGEVPLKLHKFKKARKHKPIYTVLTFAAAVIVTLGIVAGYLWYQGQNVEGAIHEQVSQAQFLHQQGKLDDALALLDQVIGDHPDHPELLTGAKADRDTWRAEKSAAERSRREAAARAEAERRQKQEDLVAQGDAKLKDQEYAAALALYESAKALGSTEGITGKIATATKWKQQQEAKAAEEERHRREEAERKRQAAEAERQRRLDYERLVAEAKRLLDDGDDDTLDQARAKAAEARRLARSEDEIKPVVDLQDTIAAALAKRRAWAAVVDFQISPSVKMDITGDAIAVKLEQALGGAYRLVTRSQVARALQELQFQTSDLVDQDKAQRFGQMVGAEYLVTGDVVQIGREITVAAKIFKVETGAIRQRGECSTDNLDAINDLFPELALILGMTDDEKLAYLNEKRNYPKHLSEGKALLEARKYAEAANALERARRAKKTPEVEALLKTAREKAEEARLLAERQATHDAAVAEGSRLLREQRWGDAEAAFRRALAVPGHTQSTEANESLKKAQGGAALAAYTAAMDEAGKLVDAQRWQEAIAAANRALQADGYTTDPTATALRDLLAAIGQLEPILTTANAAKQKGDWEQVAATLDALPQSGGRSPSGTSSPAITAAQDHLRTLFTALTALRTEAEEHLTPRLHIVSVIAGQEVPGASITVNGALQPGKTTPVTFNLQKGEAYTITVSLPESRGKRYAPYQTTFHVTRNGRQELRAVLEEQQAPQGMEPVPNATYAPLDGLAPGSREAQERQRDYVRQTGLPLEAKAAKTGILFRLVPPGEFAMGSPTGESNRDDDERQHRVRLTQGFYVGKYEVTQAQWQAVTGNNPSGFANAGADAPVEQVSWEDCQEFLRKLCTREGVPQGSYRLLTEAEWEYACRAGTETPFCYGSSLDSTQANFDGNYPYGNGRKGQYRQSTVSVGSFAPNGYGLYDMHGNVWEWCSDWYGDYPSGTVTDPTGDVAGSSRVDRGGSWIDDARYCRSAYRTGRRPGDRYAILGLRLARAVHR